VSQGATTRALGLVWHPHQKLWNARLSRRLRRLPLGRVLVRLVIATDSVLLAARVVARRVRAGWPGARGSTGDRPTVLYIDAGVHREGKQIRWMHEWFASDYDLRVVGYEASAEHMEHARERLSDLDLALDLRQRALVAPGFAEPEVKLFKSGGDGKGDSLFSQRGDDFEVAPAVRLSGELSELDPPPAHTVTLLRMNIEGAESYVIEDLVDAGVQGEIDGYFGMWDDLSKIDVGADEAFRRLLAESGISGVTFNDRDLPSPLRRWAIRFDLETSIRKGLRKTGGR
jgi:hypothetical protein